MSHVAGSEPYPWPYDGCIDGRRLALVLAGWDEGWQARVDGDEAASATAHSIRLAAAVVALEGVVIGIAHGEARAAAPVHPDAMVVRSAGLDGFWGGPLDDRLRIAGRDHLLVAGHGLEAPVHSLLRSANDRGYECLLVTDACSTLDPSLRAAAASMVCMSGGIFGAVGSAVDVLHTLTAPTPITTGVPS